VTDRITLTGVRATGYHGVLDEERRDGQPFVVDVVIDTDLSTAAATDALDDTLDYGAVAATVVAIVEGEPCRLIETLAARIAEKVLGWAAVDAVTVTVRKPQAPIPVEFADVSVSLTRTRAGRG
jgi:dihydroneopterin aldolase